MNKIRTRGQQTGESWIACIVFIMNPVKLEADMAKKKGQSYWRNIKRMVFQP
jgi:hypothetical protein